MLRLLARIPVTKYVKRRVVFHQMWFVRLAPGRGTVTPQVCDMQKTVADTQAIRSIPLRYSEVA